MSLEEDRFAELVSEIPSDQTWGIYVKNSHIGGGIFEHNAKQDFFAASLNKLAITHALNRLGVTGQGTLLLPPMSERIGGTGVLQYLPEGYEITIDDARYWMLAESDNVAAKLLVARIGGAEAVNHELAISPLDLEVTRLELLADGKFYYGKTTPAEASKLMLEIDRKYLLDRETLRKSHVQFGIREGADAKVANGTHNAIIKALKIARGRAPNRFYEMALYNLKLDASIVTLKEGSWDDDDKEEKPQHVRHQVAVFAGGLAVVAALSSHESAESFGPKHPSTATFEKIGALMHYLS